jgi:hypothetical protein
MEVGQRALPQALCKKKKKNCTRKNALENKFWVNQLNIQQGFDVDHIQQSITL